VKGTKAQPFFRRECASRLFAGERISTMLTQFAKFRLLFSKAVQGDNRARGELFECCREMITRAGYRRLNPALTSLDDDDLWQEVYFRIVSRWSSVRTKTVDRFYHWVRRVLESTRRRLEDRYTTRGKRDPARELRLDDEANRFLGELLVSGILTPVHLAQVAENQRLVRRALMNLARRERAIGQWWMDGLTLEEIAMRLGRSHSSVRRVWRAARDRLHAPLQVCS
jgi:RNA polymerase sigma factor (sigma-70 family)